MLVKFNNFYETNIGLPLSNDAKLVYVSLFRNDAVSKFIPIGNVITVSKFSYEDEQVLFDSLNVETSPKNTISKDSNTKTIAVTSQSGLVVETYTVEFELLTGSTLNIHLYYIEDNNTSSKLDILYGSADIHIIHVPWYDNATKWLDFSVSSNYSSDTIVSLISIDGTDPDDENIFGSVIGTFNQYEIDNLDADFVHLKLQNDTETMYIQLIKSFSRNSDFALDEIKRAFQWKWAYLHRQTLAFPVDALPLDVEFLFELEDSVVIEDSKAIIDANGYTYYDVSNYLDILINIAETQRVHDNHQSYLYSQSYTNYIGFTTSDIDNPAKTIAQVLVDDLSSNVTLIHGLRYWKWLAEIDDELWCKFDKAKYIEEVNANVLLSLPITSLHFINDIISYMYQQFVVLETQKYNISKDSLLIMLNTFVNILKVKESGVISSLSSFTFNGSKTFFSNIELLTKNNDIITKNSW